VASLGGYLLPPLALLRPGSTPKAVSLGDVLKSQVPISANQLVWSHLKRSLANLAKRNLGQLTALVRTRLKRMQYRPGLLDGFLASTGLDLTPFCTPHERSLAEVVGGAPAMPARPVDEAHPARS
jgi:hypothetical protein